MRDKYEVYIGDDLGISFTNDSIRLRVWSPGAQGMRVHIYDIDLGTSPASSSIDLVASDGGSWHKTLPNSFYGKYYTVQSKFNGKWRQEVPDPYAKAVGRNGKRGQFIDPTSVNPPGWDTDVSPAFQSISEAIIYEIHVRDFSIHASSGMVNKGKYLAFAERGTHNDQGLSTGIDHLVDLGISHVHLLPVFDFLSIDESKPDLPQYNWGYDPQNYFVPEGSYATNAADAQVRILEFKVMVQSLHAAGLRVVMDVVYNHTGKIDGLSFEETAPGYYYRQWADGKYSDASACGNETASDRHMFRKLMIESLKHWVEVYHIDGFRFDLMAIHDQETMQLIEKELHAIRPDLLLYGEGWTAGNSPLPVDQQALKKFTYKMPGIAAFSDDIRDGIKGSWKDHTHQGYASGNLLLREQVKFGIVGAINHPGIDSSKVASSKLPWAGEPTQAINYVSCHDNHTLIDKLRISNPGLSDEDLQSIQLLCNGIVLTAEGIPFLHAGAEMLRTKQGVENSYNAPDSVNAIDWNWKSDHADVYTQYKALIAMRKAHPGFRMDSGQMVRERLRFLDSEPDLLGYQILSPVEDQWSMIMVWLNVSPDTREVDFEEGLWKLAYPAQDHTKFLDRKYKIAPRSLAILYQDK